MVVLVFDVGMSGHLPINEVHLPPNLFVGDFLNGGSKIKVSGKYELPFHFHCHHVGYEINLLKFQGIETCFWKILPV